MLNTKALLRYEYVGNDVYRCYLPKVVLLNFEVAPIVDLFVAASDKDCRVEMRQCMVFLNIHIHFFAFILEAYLNFVSFKRNIVDELVFRSYHMSDL